MPPRRSSRIAQRLGIQVPSDIKSETESDVIEQPIKTVPEFNLDELNKSIKSGTSSGSSDDDSENELDIEFDFDQEEDLDEFDYSNGLRDPELDAQILRTLITIKAQMQTSSTNAPTNSTSTEPSKSLEPSPDKTYTCKCGQPAKKFLCHNGRPENVGKYYFTCANRNKGGCKYWEWVESAHDSFKRNNKWRSKSYDRPTDEKKQFKCHCGFPTRRLVSRNGMPHNIGRAFLVCASRKCDFWIWADGTLPFSDEAQGRFNKWADSEGLDLGMMEFVLRG